MWKLVRQRTFLACGTLETRRFQHGFQLAPRPRLDVVVGGEDVGGAVQLVARVGLAHPRAVQLQLAALVVAHAEEVPAAQVVQPVFFRGGGEKKTGVTFQLACF